LVPGEVLDETGEVVGTHEGVAAYTLGQRHGFVLSAQTPNTVPHYVVAKDAEFNTITVSPNKFPTQAARTTVTLVETNWIGDIQSGPYQARYRYRQQLIRATLDAATNTVVLDEPHYIPVGQTLVLYKQDRCLGGGSVDTANLS
jgi:tRNA-uridine 2-sulfurtransferase